MNAPKGSLLLIVISRVKLYCLLLSEDFCCRQLGLNLLFGYQITARNNLMKAQMSANLLNFIVILDTKLFCVCHYFRLFFSSNGHI